MSQRVILASGSTIRAQMLRNARVCFDVIKPLIDEQSVKDAMIAEAASPRDVAETLAEMKAKKISQKKPEAFVIGSDQVLDHQGRILSKPNTPAEAVAQITALSNDKHSLFSAVVIYQGGAPLWRHVGQVRLQMRELSDAYIADYVARNFDQIQHCVGGYQLEGEGVRLMTNVQGDYFTVLGMPLIQILGYLAQRGVIET